jgi:hypothetical protein
MQHREVRGQQRIPRRTEHPGAVARRRRRRWRLLLVLLAVLLAAPLFFDWGAGPALPQLAAPAAAPSEPARSSLLQATRDRLEDLVRPISQ